MSNASGNFEQVAESVESTPVSVKVDRISAQELHKYVLGLLSLFMLFVVTYPISMSRVTEKEKFAPYQSHLKSLTLEYKPVEPTK